MPRGRPEQQDIQRALAEHLRSRAAPDLVWWSAPNGGYRRQTEAAIMADQDVRAFAIELKAPPGRLTEAQNLNRALAVCESWGLLRGLAQ